MKVANPAVILASNTARQTLFVAFMRLNDLIPIVQNVLSSNSETIAKVSSFSSVEDRQKGLYFGYFLVPKKRYLAHSAPVPTELVCAFLDAHTKRATGASANG